MASVYNSRNSVVSNFDTSGFTGRWEDIQSYVNVISTLDVGTDTSGTVYLDWLNTDDDDVPTTDTSALLSDSYTFSESQAITKQFDTRARWFRLRIEGTGNSLNQISTLYKKTPTEIKLTDDNTNIVSVNLGDGALNSLYTVLTDTSGAIIGSTNDAHSGEALYTHLADASGSGLATTDNNRDIVRSLGATDVSFVFSTDGENSGNRGSIIVSENRFRLPKSTIPFKDGDTVRFAMGVCGDTDFGVDGAFATPTDTSGVLKVTGTVRYRETEASHIQFELLVDKDMSEWFDPTVGFTNFDPSHIVGPVGDLPAEAQPVVGVDGTGSGHAYLYDVSDGTVSTIDQYYKLFSDSAGFDQGNGISLNPGSYPMDLRFYRGSLAYDSTENIHIASYDLSAANDPAESLAVALRDNDNDNLGSTGVGSTVYKYHSGRPTNTNILFMVDACLNLGGSPGQLTEDVLGACRLIAADISTGYGTAPQTAVATYNDGLTYPVAAVNVDDPADVEKSVLRGLSTDTLSDDWDSDNYVNVDYTAYSGTSNFWKALKDYSNSESTNTGYNTIFDSNLDAIVLFNFGDSSSSYADRMGFDASSSFFNGVEKIVVTGTNNDLTELLSFAGTTDNIYQVDTLLDLDACTAFHQTLGRRLAGVKHVGNNALHVHTTDVCGTSQAGTRPITGAENGDVALYYALADACGTKLDTTLSNTSSTGLNAAYVSLVTKSNSQGTAIDPTKVSSVNPLHITFDALGTTGKMFDMTVSGVPVTIDDLSNNNVTLRHIGIANETATTIWLKVYDMSVGFYDGSDKTASALESNLVYNLAVPGLDYRDFEFSKGVKFDNGIYVVASTNYLYNSFVYPPGNKHIYVHGSYEDIA